MPQFRYEVTDKAGKPMRGVMDAPSESDVHQRLVARGYSVNRVIPVAAPGPQHTPQAQPVAPNPQAVVGPTMRTYVPSKEMSVFFRGLASFLKAGTPIHQTLVQIGMQTPNRGLRFICERMAMRVQMGQNLSTAMMEFPRTFPPHVVGVVMAGELGGFLSTVIGDIALDYEIAQRATMRFGKIINWFLWINALAPLPFVPVPVLVFRMGGESLLQDPSPAHIAAICAQASGYGMRVIGIPLLILVAAYFIAGYILKQPSTRPIAHRWLLMVPQVGRASRERSLASFTRILWRLQNAGILPIRAWDAASRAAENVVVSSRLYSQLAAIQAGVPFSQALAMTGLFTSEDQRVLAMGEASGQVADVLERIAAFYEDSAQHTAGRARWFGIRAAIIATLASIGITTVSIALVYPEMMRWVDKYFAV